MLLAIEKTLNWKPRKTHEILLSPELAIIKEYKALMDAEKSEPCCCGGGEVCKAGIGIRGTQLGSSLHVEH